MSNNIFKPYIERSKQVFSSFSKEEIDHLNAEVIKKTDECHSKFVQAFSKGQCSLCGSPIKTFSVNQKPCLHWLLYPSGIKKKNFNCFWGIFGYFRMEAYLRWVASLDAKIININDLKIEKNQEKIILITHIPQHHFSHY